MLSISIILWQVKHYVDFNTRYTPLVTAVISVKLLRTAYCNASQMTAALLLAVLIELFDVKSWSSTSDTDNVHVFWLSHFIQFPTKLAKVLLLHLVDAHFTAWPFASVCTV